MAKRRGIVSSLLGPRGKQPRPGFAAAKAANAKGARGGGGNAGMRKVLGAGAQKPTSRPTKARGILWMGDPWRGKKRTSGRY